MMSYDVKKSHILCHIINYKTAFFYYILESVKRQYLKIWLRQQPGDSEWHVNTQKMNDQCIESGSRETLHEHAGHKLRQLGGMDV